MSSDMPSIDPDSGIQFIPISHETNAQGASTEPTSAPVPSASSAPPTATELQPHDGIQYIPISNSVALPPAPGQPYTLSILSQVPAGASGSNGYVNVVFLLENLTLTTNGNPVTSPKSATQLGATIVQVPATSVDSSGNANHQSQFTAVPVDPTKKSGFTIVTFGHHIALPPAHTTVPTGS